MDWENVIDTLYIWYHEFIEWYLIQPISAQIFAIVGIITILAFLVTLVFYIIKGIAYLFLYILKGIYYILKGIGLGIFKLCEGFYKLISGKLITLKRSQNSDSQVNMNIREINNGILYCSECGRQFSEKMTKNIFTIGFTYCIKCGKQYKVNNFQESLIRTH